MVATTLSCLPADLLDMAGVIHAALINYNTRLSCWSKLLP